MLLRSVSGRPSASRPSRYSRTAQHHAGPKPSYDEVDRGTGRFEPACRICFDNARVDRKAFAADEPLVNASLQLPSQGQHARDTTAAKAPYRFFENVECSGTVSSSLAGKTSGRPSSDALLRKGVARSGYRSSSRRPTSGSSVPDRSTVGRCGCKTGRGTPVNLRDRELE